eukprot:3772462-Pyramimonas_sp.AAC.1
MVSGGAIRYDDDGAIQADQNFHVASYLLAFVRNADFAILGVKVPHEFRGRLHQDVAHRIHLVGVALRVQALYLTSKCIPIADRSRRGAERGQGVVMYGLG